MSGTQTIRVRIKQRWCMTLRGFGWHIIALDAGLNDLYMGRTLEEVNASLAELNAFRATRGAAAVELYY